MEADARLLAESQTNPEAFRILYRRHAEDLIAFLRRGSGNAETALDLFAETMATAFERRDKFDAQKGSVRQWLFGIARHELAAFWRSDRVRMRAVQRLVVTSPELDDESQERIDGLIDAGRARSELIAALKTLPEHEREAVLYRYIAERDYPEIAAALGISVGAARVRVHRGLAKLREQLV